MAYTVTIGGVRQGCPQTTKTGARRIADRCLDPPNPEGFRIKIWDHKRGSYLTENYGGRRHDFGASHLGGGHALPSDHPGAP